MEQQFVFICDKQNTLHQKKKKIRFYLQSYDCAYDFFFSNKYASTSDLTKMTTFVSKILPNVKTHTSCYLFDDCYIFFITMLRSGEKKNEFLQWLHPIGRDHHLFFTFLLFFNKSSFNETFFPNFKTFPYIYCQKNI